MRAELTTAAVLGADRAGHGGVWYEPLAAGYEVVSPSGRDGDVCDCHRQLRDLLG